MVNIVTMESKLVNTSDIKFIPKHRLIELHIIQDETKTIMQGHKT